MGLPGGSSRKRLELRRNLGLGMVTALIRIEGRPLGVIANNPIHLAGAIDRDGADKAARFMQLCDAFDIRILFLCDTPGIMVGPEIEKTALVRHVCVADCYLLPGSTICPHTRSAQKHMRNRKRPD
jgi:acetyl-CoA carboxylase carboxyltransferase component